MENVYKLTIEQKDALVGQTYDGEQFINPPQDADGNWFISQEVVNNTNNPELMWVKDLPLIAYNPIVSELPF
jgi:hypothetical protein